MPERRYSVRVVGTLLPIAEYDSPSLALTYAEVRRRLFGGHVWIQDSLDPGLGDVTERLRG